MATNRATRPLFLALFFLSGISGLVYQIVWTRELVLVFGNTLLANSTVLSAFMAGLAAGSFVLGEYIDRRPRGLLRLYAVLEIGIGLFGLAFPLLLSAFAPLYSSVYLLLGENLLLLNLIRFALCFLLILVPTFFMGGTLPVLVKYFVSDLRRIGYQVGFLYGLNTAGAVIGCVAAGYWLLGSLGMQRTTWVAVAINLGVGLAAWVLGRSRADQAVGETEDEEREMPTGRAVPRSSPVVVRAVLIGIGVSGFCALAYEVLWVRMLNLFLNNNVYSFTATIATFLIGIAVGSLVYSQLLSRLKNQLLLFAAIEIGIGILAYCTPFLFNLLQLALFSNRAESVTLLKTVVIMVGPTLLMGMAVPLAVQICQWGKGREGRSVGAVYAFNTVGSILGAFVAGFVLIPVVGLHKGLIVAACLNVAAGFLVLIAAVRPVKRLALGGVLAVALALLVVLAPPSLFRDLYLQATPDSEILHYKEGKVVNVVVYDFYKTGYKDLHLNGIEEASSRLWHVQLFKMLGALPVVVHENPDEALMIAFGAGMSAGTTAQLVSSLDVVDLNPDIHGPAEVFRRENLDVIDNPKVNLIANDGRNELLLSPRKYSVIISDATNPKMFDSWTLYTKEFYELTKSRLKPGGVFSQWLVHPIPGDSIKVVLNTFRQVYPHASLWCIYGSSQCLMLGTPERLSLDYEQLTTRLESVLGTVELDDYGIDSVPKFLSFLLLGEDGLDDLLRGFEKISTDDLPHPQFQMGQALEGTRSSLDLLKYQDSALTYLTSLGEAEGGLERQFAILESISRRLNLGFLLGNRNEYLEAEAVARRAGMAYEPNVASALRYDKKRQEYFEERLRLYPEEVGVYNHLGYIHWMGGRHGEAIAVLRKALELNPQFANARANLAQVYLEAELLDESEAELLRLRRENPTATVMAMVPNRLALIRLLRKQRYQPDSADSYIAVGEMHLGSGEPVRAVDAMAAAAELRPDDLQTQLRLAALYENLEWVSEALAAYRKAAAIAPGDARIERKMAQFQRLASDRNAHQEWLNSNEIVLREGGGVGGHPAACVRAAKVWSDYPFEGAIKREKLREAAELFEDSTDLDSGHLHAYVSAAKIYEAIGAFGEAAAILGRAPRDDRTATSLDRRILRLEHLAGLEDGEMDVRQRVEAWRKVAQLFVQEQEPERAIEALRRALDEGAGLATVWVELADVYLLVGRYEAALAALRQAERQELTPEREGLLRSRIEIVEEALGSAIEAGDGQV